MIRDRSVMRGWPPILVEIAEIVGVAAALRLVDAYGGTTLYVPETAAPEHRLVQSIGAEAAIKLTTIYAMCKIEVPTLRMVRTRKALIAATVGKTSEIARELGVTTRWVRMVRSIGSIDARQMDLFHELNNTKGAKN